MSQKHQKQAYIRVQSNEMGFKAVWHFANRRELAKWRKERLLIEFLETQQLVEIPSGFLRSR